MVDFSFLNFTLILFTFCVALMVVISMAGKAPEEAVERLTVQAGEREKLEQEGERLLGAKTHVTWTVIVAVTILALWIYFA